jgi:hypothetical protein
MRSMRLTFAIFLLVSMPGIGLAKSWQGVTPGVTDQSDVIAKFGEPSTRGRHGGRVVLVYKGEQVIEGTKQAQFYLQADGKVAEINVFPATRLGGEAVEGTYGSGSQKTFTDDFKPVWVYRSLGVMVFFGKDGAVDSISFRPAEAAAKRAPQPKPADPPPAAEKKNETSP